MTDLTEMVEWLRREIKSEKLAAEKATPGPWRWSDLSGQVREDSQFGRAVATAARTVDDLIHIATHDPADTIARCEAELAIIDEHACEAGLCRTCTLEEREVLWDGEQETVEWVRKGVEYPCRTIQKLAYGRRHRPGWKAEWKA